MTRFLDWCAFLGAWLLFAGPVYQAETELDEEARDADEMLDAAHSVEAPPSPSAWWWLLPPVAWYLHRAQNRVLRERVREVLTEEQIAQFLRFSEKATGWMFVAGGAGLIALKESWSLTRAYGWGDAIYWALVALMLVVSFGWTAYRATTRHKVLGVERRQPRSR